MRPRPLPALVELLDAGRCRWTLEPDDGRVSLVGQLRADRHDSRLATVEALERIEARCTCEFEHEYGVGWADVLGRCRRAHLADIRRAARTIDTLVRPPDPGRAVAAVRAFRRALAVRWPHEARATFGAPARGRWFAAPLGAWAEHVGDRLRIPARTLRRDLASVAKVDDRTVGRWLSGRRALDALVPRAAFVDELLRTVRRGSVDAAEVRHTAGWLVLALAFQSVPVRERERLRRTYDAHDETDDPVAALGRALAACAVRTRETGDAPAEALSGPWESARRARRDGSSDEALAYYDKAMSVAWWRAGLAQEALLDEAGVFASGVRGRGARVLARECRAGLQLLGVNRPVGRVDDIERQRLAAAFGARHAPRRSVHPAARLPGLARDAEPRPVSSEDRRDPNAMRSDPEGRTRGTALVEAARRGDLDEMKRLLARSDTDPDTFVRVTGESALSAALERAQSEHDPAPLHLLVGLELSVATVTRAFGPFRTTPLEIAIEIADTLSVRRLIELGTGVESPTSSAPSALVCALSVLHGSTPQGALGMTRRYVAGEGGADVFDATRGTATDAAAARERRQLASATTATVAGRAEAAREYRRWSRLTESYRRVVLVLLESGARPNARYVMPGAPFDRWAPTLLAAEIGYLPVLQDLVRRGGDVMCALREDVRAGRLDALALAAHHGHIDVQRWLRIVAGTGAS